METGVVNIEMVQRGGWAELLSGKNLSLLLAISSGIGLHAFNQFAVVPSLPVAVAEIGGATIYSLAYSVYFVCSVAGGVTAIIFRERFGARVVLTLSSLLFIAGIVMCSVAGSFEWVVIGRALQGLADGLIVAVCYSLIPSGFASAFLPKVFAVEAAVWAVASVLGPMLGGLATEEWSWRAVFWLPLPLILLMLACAGVSVAVEQAEISRRKLTVPLTLCVVGALVLSAPSLFETATMRCVSLLVGALLMWASVRIGVRPSSRVFPGDAFRPGTVVGHAFWMMFLMSYAHALCTVYLGLVVVHRWQYSPTLSGFLIVTMPLAWSLVAMLAGSFHNARVKTFCLAFGPPMMVAGSVTIGLGLASGNLWLMLVGQTLNGIGFGLAWAEISQAAMSASAQHERKMTGALLPTVATLGSAAGAGASGTIVAATGLVPALQHGDISPSLFWLYGLATMISLAAVLASRRLITNSRNLEQAPG
jgi:MFS family permease